MRVLHVKLIKQKLNLATIYICRKLKTTKASVLKFYYTMHKQKQAKHVYTVEQQKKSTEFDNKLTTLNS